jgi:sarcosine oxidase, subunit gamma
MADRMMLDRVRPTPATAAAPGTTLQVERGLGIAKLRVFYRADGDARFRALIGADAPNAHGQIEHGGMAFAWLAPGEWLVTGPETAVADWLRAIDGRAGDEALVVDVSHARTCFVLGGGNARAVLAAHCPLDLWPGRFAVGAVARSLLGDTAMIIARLSDDADGARFRIIVDQTMAAYAARLLGRI